jgi:hypothetical protein
MAVVNQPKQAQYGTRRSAVVEVAELRVHLVKWSNAEGRETLSLVATGAKSSDDGGLGVWVLGEEKDLQENLKVANKIIREGMRARMGAEADSLPAQIVPTSNLSDVFGSTEDEKEGKE